ncbi:MAG: type IV pilus biogenesis/stability protein PilW [Betaproteobacteria bacterium]|nr:type IV pilus biogenesis/stability protein PilW [Betaproteobacteria bacterium]
MKQKRSWLVPLVFTAVLVAGCNSNPPREAAASEPESQAPVSSDAQKSARVHTELGSLYFQEGNLAVALEELRLAIRADSSYAPAYNVLGLVHMDLRENDAAEQNFRQALSLAGNDPEINNNYGWFLCQTGRERQSIAYFTAAVKNPLYQTPERAYLNAGRCSEKSNDLAGAESFYQKALRFSRNNTQAMLAMAGLQYKQGNLDEAYRQVREIHRLSDPNAESLWLAVRLARKLGDRAEEASYMAQLRRRFPASREAQAMLKGDFE